MKAIAICAFSLLIALTVAVEKRQATHCSSDHDCSSMCNHGEIGLCMHGKCTCHQHNRIRPERQVVACTTDDDCVCGAGQTPDCHDNHCTCHHVNTPCHGHGDCHSCPSGHTGSCHNGHCDCHHPH